MHLDTPIGLCCGINLLLSVRHVTPISIVRLDLLPEILQTMKVHNIGVNHNFYSSLIEAYCRVGHFSSAIVTLAEMKQQEGGWTVKAAVTFLSFIGNKTLGPSLQKRMRDAPGKCFSSHFLCNVTLTVCGAGELLSDEEAIEFARLVDNFAATRKKTDSTASATSTTPPPSPPQAQPHQTENLW